VKTKTIFMGLMTGLVLAVAAEPTVKVKAPQVVNVAVEKARFEGVRTIVVEKGAQLDLAVAKVDNGKSWSTPTAGATIHIAGEGPDGRGALVNDTRMIYNASGHHLTNLVLDDDATIGGARFDLRGGSLTGDHWLTVKNRGAERSDVFAFCHDTKEVTIKGLRVTDGGAFQLCNPNFAAPAGIELTNGGAFGTWSSMTISATIAVTVGEGGGRIFSDKDTSTYAGKVTVTKGSVLKVTDGTWYPGRVVFAGELVNDGVVEVTAASLTITGKVKGSGVLRATGGVLDIAEADLSEFRGKVEETKNVRRGDPALAEKFRQTKDWKPGEWPVVRKFDGAHLREISMPMGGIGTGNVALGGRGELRDWQLKDRPDRGAPHDGNASPFFAVWAKPVQGGKAVVKMLAGPLEGDEFSSNSGRGNGSAVPNFGMPRFERAKFEAAYPFGVATLESNELPIRARVKGFNPFIPGDAEASGLPVAVVTYEIENLANAAMEVSVAGAMRNLAGNGGHQFCRAKGFKGLVSRTGGRDSVCLGVATAGKVTARLGCDKLAWNGEILQLWDDISDDGELTVTAPVGRSARPLGALAVKKTIAPRAKECFTFYITWHFPARTGWCPKGRQETNWYAQHATDAWDAFLKIAPRVPGLERRTCAFVSAFANSSLPTEVKDAALSTAAVLKSPTVFRIASGHMMTWEGTGDTWGSCNGNCTHVWNYEYATPYLFGELARSMREVELVYGLEDDGKMWYRINMPLGMSPKGRRAISDTAFDGQMGTLMQTYREWQLSGDDAFLKKMYPLAKKALAFAWKKVPENNWDIHETGLADGSLFNTMDCWYYGPNALCEFWYLGALRAGEELAKSVGDAEFAAKCRRIFESGSRLTDQKLFNGDFYRQIVYKPNTYTPVDASDPTSGAPDLQVGEGCETDGLAGQNMAWTLGLGDLAQRGNLAAHLRTIATTCYRANFHEHFTNMRGYAMGDDAGLLNTSYPRGKRPVIPYPYYSEVWTGIEYTAAAGMELMGMEAEALRTVRDVRNRHDGAKRNPFSEPECGHYYARSMAAWSLVVAWPGFRYSAPAKTMKFAAKDGEWFWSTGGAFGTAKIRGKDVQLNLIEGKLPEGLKVSVE